MLNKFIYVYAFTTGIFDSSGVRFFYTDQPPEQEAAFLGVGHQVIGHMMVPPRVERYAVHGHCSQRCTNAVSIYVFYSMYICMVIFI